MLREVYEGIQQASWEANTRDRIDKKKISDKECSVTFKTWTTFPSYTLGEPIISQIHIRMQKDNR